MTGDRWMVHPTVDPVRLYHPTKGWTNGQNKKGRIIIALNLKNGPVKTLTRSDVNKMGTISNEMRTFAEFKDTPQSSSLQAETQEFP